jgi:soluble lytic murein transglycosylase-like protein
MVFMLSSPQLTEEQSRTVAAEVHDAARSHGEDPILFAALIADESHFNRRARNARVGAYGMAQLHPLFWGAGLEHASDFVQLYRGAEALRHYRERCGGDWRAVSAYRAGLPDGQCPNVTSATKRVMKTRRIWASRWSALHSRDEAHQEAGRPAAGQRPRRP